jgi:hypothetical protein
LEKLSEALELGSVKVDKKQKCERTKSGTTWEIDRVGITKDGQKVVAIECRRYPDRRIKQSEMAALAYIKHDIDAKSAIVVTPKGVQAGGIKIAEHENIIIIRLDKDATTTDFLLQTMDKRIVGAGFSGHGELRGTAVPVTPPTQ